MSIDDDISALRTVPLFSSLTVADLNVIALAGNLNRFRPGESLITIEDEGTWAHVILTGEVEVLTAGTPHAKRIAIRGSGAVIGEIALLCDVPRTATVKALDEVETLRIEQSEFLALLHDRPAMAVDLCKALAMKIESLPSSV